MAVSGLLGGGSGKLADMKRRLWFLLLALIVYRIGAHVPVPGIDPVVLKDLFDSQQGGILGMFNMFSGGALSRFSVFALGIMPYISASYHYAARHSRFSLFGSTKEKKGKLGVGRSLNTLVISVWGWH